MKLTRRRFLHFAGLAGATVAGCSSNTQSGSGDAGPDVNRAEASTSDATAHDVPDATDATAADDATDVAPVRDLDALPEDTTSFPLGVMAGDIDATSAVIWTKFAGTGALSLRVHEVAGTTAVRTVYDGEVSPDPDGFVHFLVAGLNVGARHRYAFVVRDSSGTERRSTVGRFRAAIADDALEPLVIAGTSCTHQLLSPFPNLQHCAARDDIDFFIHSGDHVYSDNPAACVTLADYRDRYNTSWSSPGLQALHASVGMYETWDDHEVDDNWDPEMKPADVVAAARRAFFDYRPVRRDTTDADRIWRSFRWGNTAEIIILDCRGERLPSTRNSAQAQYVSPEQLAWLKLKLMTSTAVFKLIVNSVPITNFPLVFDAGAKDRWEGYPAQRDDLLNFIASQGIENVWWLSGDFHFACVAKVEPSGASSNMREVLLGPSGARNINQLYLSLSGSQFDYSGGKRCYSVLRLDPAARSVTVQIVDDSGSVLFDRAFT